MSFITNDVSLILNRLEKGLAVAIPTETVYGLAADYLNEQAIENIYRIKNRPQQHPLIMHIHPDWDLSEWVESIPIQAKDLIKKYWPGPLTLVFRMKSGCISPLITGGQNTVAIRAPNHPLMLKILQALGRPIVAPSANPFEKLSPTTAWHVQQHFLQEDLAILEGGRCQVGIESTIVDMASQIGQVLRPGQLKLSSNVSQQSSIRVPGAQSKHYQPYKPCYYFESSEQLNFPLDDYYVMCFQKDAKIKTDYYFPEDFAQICYEFYYQLQIADESPYSSILIERPKNPELQMISDKIQRASQIISMKL